MFLVRVQAIPHFVCGIEPYCQVLSQFLNKFDLIRHEFCNTASMQGKGKHQLSKIEQYKCKFFKQFVCVVVDYVDMGISRFVIEYLRKNEKMRKSVLACSCRAQV